MKKEEEEGMQLRSELLLLRQLSFAFFADKKNITSKKDPVGKGARFFCFVLFCFFLTHLHM